MQSLPSSLDHFVAAFLPFSHLNAQNAQTYYSRIRRLLRHRLRRHDGIASARLPERLDMRRLRLQTQLSGGRRKRSARPSVHVMVSVARRLKDKLEFSPSVHRLEREVCRASRLSRSSQSLLFVLRVCLNDGWDHVQERCVWCNQHSPVGTITFKG